MIENPGKTPDFAIFASLNKDGAFPAWCVVTGPCELIPRQYVEVAILSKWQASDGGHCSH